MYVYAMCELSLNFSTGVIIHIYHVFVFIMTFSYQHLYGLLRFSDLRLEVSGRLDDNDGIVHAYLSFLFLKHRKH